MKINATVLRWYCDGNIISYHIVSYLRRGATVTGDRFTITYYVALRRGTTVKCLVTLDIISSYHDGCPPVSRIHATIAV